MAKSSKIASHGNSGRLAGPFFLHFWASLVKLSVHAKFQLPRWCASCFSMVEEKKEEKLPVLMATLATAQTELS